MPSSMPIGPDSDRFLCAGNSKPGTGKQEKMTAPPDDAVVISRSLTDPAHFAIVFDRHVGAVHRFLERRLGRDVADSLAGEVFRIGFERRATYQLERPNCLPWLYGIAKNLLLKERRQQARHLRALGRLGTRDDPTPAGMNAIDARLDAEVLWPRLAQALAELPVGERDVILLVAWEELSYQEVAEVLDVPIGTVRSRLHRARHHLRELMGPCGQEPDDNPQRAEGGCRP